MSTVMAVSPFLLLVAAGLAIMLLDAFVHERAELAFVTAVSLFGAAALAGAGAIFGVHGPLPSALTSYLAIDRFSFFFQSVICLGGAMTALLAGGYLPEHRLDRGELYVLILFSSVGAMVLASAANLITLFIGIETMALGVYAMAGFRRTSPRALEGAIKYFLLGSFAAAVLLFGSAMLYGATGSLDFAGITESIRSGRADVVMTAIGLPLLLIGLVFEVSAVPFHQWTPDVYEGSVTPATTYMSIAVKTAAFAILVRVLAVSFGDSVSASVSTGWPAVIVALSILTMLYGNFTAIVQSNVKRMLAYSSIAHAGYVLVGVAAISRVGELAVSATLYYLLAYTFSNVLAFGSLIWAGSRGKEAVSYDDIAGLGRRHPGVGLAFSVGVLSLLGFPPTAGFFGKYYVFNAAVQAGGGFVYLAVLGVLASAVGAYYYLKVIVYLYMREPEEDAPVAVPMRSGYVVAALLIAAFGVIEFGIFPGHYLEVALSAAHQLLG